MKRNPDAHCGNCPYFCPDGHSDRDGYCRRHPIPESVIHGEGYWCGEHPDFEVEEETPATVQGLTIGEYSGIDPGYGARHPYRSTD